jgi:hypothetical protein
VIIAAAKTRAPAVALRSRNILTDFPEEITIRRHRCEPSAAEAAMMIRSDFRLIETYDDAK